MTKNQAEIIKAVLYFDVFKYPLTKDELFQNSNIKISKDSFNEELAALLRANMLKQKGEFVLSTEQTPEDVLNRIKGNEGAKNVMATAYKYSRRIASFPFVEGVCLSGSLSKNYYDKNGDIDYFIITKPGRLWICRTLLVLRYKLLPKNKKKYWCTNYFVSLDNLAIPDINVFTGTELAYLIPTVNYSAYKKILAANSWYKEKFPNKAEALPDNCINMPNWFLKLIIEISLSGKIGSWLDNRLLEITLRHWRKKYPEMNNEDFELQFRSRKDVCKRHTHGFQNRIIVSWQNKMHEFETLFNISLQ